MMYTLVQYGHDIIIVAHTCQADKTVMQKVFHSSCHIFLDSKGVLEFILLLNYEQVWKLTIPFINLIDHTTEIIQHNLEFIWQNGVSSHSCSQSNIQRK
jgi:hypothetical protein